MPPAVMLKMTLSNWSSSITPIWILRSYF